MTERTLVLGSELPETPLVTPTVPSVSVTSSTGETSTTGQLVLGADGPSAPAPSPSIYGLEYGTYTSSGGLIITGWYRPPGKVNPKTVNNVSDEQEVIRQASVLAADDVVPVTFGRDRFFAKPMFFQEFEGFMYVPFLVGEGEIHSYENIYVDGVDINDTEEGFLSKSGAQVNTYRGTFGQLADPLLIAAFGGTFDDTYENFAYLVLKIPKGATNGIPRVEVEIKGKKITNYDTHSAFESTGASVGVRNLALNSANAHLWPKFGVTTVDTGTDVGPFNKIEVKSTGSAANRADCVEEIINVDQIAITVYASAGTSNQIRIYAVNTGRTLSSYMSGTLSSLSVGSSAAGTLTVVDNQDFTTYRLIRLLFTPSFPGDYHSIGVGPNSSTSGNGVYIYGAQVENAELLVVAHTGNPINVISHLMESKAGWTVNADSAIAAALWNSEILAGDMYPRREMGMTYSKPTKLSSLLQNVLAYTGCSLSWKDGEVHFIPYKARATDHIFNADNIEDIKVSKKTQNEIPTLVMVQYTDITDEYQKREVTKYAAGVLEGTTPRRTSRINLPGVHSHAQAAREAIERLNTGLSDLILRLSVFDEGLKVEIGDVAEITHAPLGLSSKKVTVLGLQQKAPGLWDMEVEEYDPLLFSEDIETTPTYPDTTLPVHRAPAIITGVNAVEEVYQLQNGNYASRIRVTWNASINPYLLGYKVRIVQLATLIETIFELDTEAVSGPLQEGVEYYVYVAAYTSLYEGQPGSDVITLQGKTATPAAPSNLSGTNKDSTVFLYWTASATNDVRRYEVRYYTTAQTWDQGETLEIVDGLNLTTSGVVPDGAWRFGVKAIDSVGNKSTTATEQDITVAATSSSGITIFYQDDIPTSLVVGDLWVDTDDNNHTYRADSVGADQITTGEWESIRDLTIGIAQAAAEAAQSDADDANAALAIIASDGILSEVEKSQVKLQVDAINGEQAGIDATATSYSITTEKTAYDNAVSALNAYLATLTSPVLWSNVTNYTTLDSGTSFRSKFELVYTTRQALLDAIAAKAKLFADNAQSDATQALQDALDATNAASTAQTAANTANDAIADIADDDILSVVEKSQVILQYDTIIAEESGIVAEAVRYGITTKKTNYQNAVSALTTYLGGLTSPVLWSNLTNQTDLGTGGGATFRSAFALVYSTRQLLLDEIVKSAKDLADAAQQDATQAIQDAADAQQDATDALGNAATANAAIADIADDDILSAVEKSQVILQYNTITGEQAGIVAEAVRYNITTKKTTYQNAITALTNYLATLTSPVLWSNTSGQTNLGAGGGATFRTNFQTVYTARQALLDEIAKQAKALADAAQSDATQALQDALDAATAAGLAQDDADAANTAIANISDDDILSVVEKSQVILQVNTINGEKAGILAEATSYAITTQKTTYDNEVTALNNYLATLTSPVLWSNLTNQTNLGAGGGATFRTNFADVYLARQDLLDAIAAKAKVLADNAQSTATSAADSAATAIQDAADAQSLAQLAKDTADGKIVTYLQSNDPAVEFSLGAGDVGDLWINTGSTPANLMSRWSGSAWISVQDAYIADVEALANTKITTYYQTNAPASPADGDLWVDTSSADNVWKRYKVGVGWQSIFDEGDVSTALATANGKNTIYYQDAPGPTVGVDEDDLWFDTADGNKPYVYVSGQWEDAQDTSIADKQQKITIETTTKVASFPAVSFWRYPCNTTSQPFTMTLPSLPDNGDTVYVFDAGAYFDVNPLTVARNGQNIMGDSSDLVMDIRSFSCGFQYVGSTMGWVIV